MLLAILRQLLHEAYSMSFQSLEERAGLSDSALELVAWKGVLKRFLGARAFEVIERAVFDELRTQL
jgi:hypothetical protein